MAPVQSYLASVYRFVSSLPFLPSSREAVWGSQSIISTRFLRWLLLLLLLFIYTILFLRLLRPIWRRGKSTLANIDGPSCSWPTTTPPCHYIVYLGSPNDNVLCFLYPRRNGLFTRCHHRDRWPHPLQIHCLVAVGRHSHRPLGPSR